MSRAGWRATAVTHQSNESHSIRTGSSVLLAVYGRRGDLAAPSWYSPGMNIADTDKAFPLLADRSLQPDVKADNNM